MKTHLHHSSPQKGYALLITTMFLGIGLAILASSFEWASTNARLTDRNNHYFKAVAAAEAATEEVIAEIGVDYANGGSALVSSQITNKYRSLYPLESEQSDWAKYQFSNAEGVNNETYVAETVAESYTNLHSTYRGLLGTATSYRIVSNAKDISHGISAAVQQDIQTATIPLFQFAIFYSLDLEIHPGPNMDITGRVHGNRNIYSKPGATLTFFNDVTAVGEIKYEEKSGDGSGRGGNNEPVYKPGVHVVAPSDSLILPVGDSNNTPESVQSILQIPPVGESAGSVVGQQRYYNKSAMTIVVSDTGTEIRSGVAKGNKILTNTVNFVSTTTSYDKRENKNLNLVEIDVAKLKTYSQSTASAELGKPLDSIYVADERTTVGNTLGAVRLVNGQTLPKNGLTVATPNPLYVKGDYNAPAADLGTERTANTKPASLVADAITVLSGNWSDAKATQSIGNRAATPTTINAAFLAGIVETSASNSSGPGKGYSGGVENFPRFLEDWNGDKFTYNGSMVVLFPSTKAIAPWKGTGTVYNAPIRKWAFDINFLDEKKLPPGTPAVRTLVRNNWASIPTNTIAAYP